MLTQTFAPFVDSVGNDREGLHPRKGGGLISGATPGLYAAAPTVPACDRGKLAALLAQDPVKAAAWAQVQGITSDRIGPFLADTTPVLLAADTLVRNHRFENGTAVGYPALLQAGTAVLVDRWGRPVAKCSCGNPLARLTPVPDTFEPHDMATAWRTTYQSSAVVSVTAAHAPLPRLDLDDATTPGRLVVRPTGTDGEADTTAPRPTGPSPDDSDDTAAPTPDPTDASTPSDASTTSAPTTPGATSTRDGTATPTPTTTTPRTPTGGTFSGGTPTGTGGGTPTPTAPSAHPTFPTGPTRRVPTEPVPPPAEPTVLPTWGPSARPAPSLTLSPATVRIGSTSTARAAGFAPGEAVRFAWTGPSAGTIDAFAADATGTTTGRTASAPLRVV